ncbi:MAG: tetratricopeptide repeat protein [Rhizomicrobium sp.]
MRMALIAPKRAEVWFDLARLNESAGVLGAARRAYERCLELTPAGEGCTTRSCCPCRSSSAV